jgi:hypothetical protein
MKSRFLTSLTIASTLVIGTVGSQVFSNSAKAASITQTSGYLDQLGTPTATNYHNKPVVPDLKQFDQAALGQLTEVDILVSGNITGVGTSSSHDAGPTTVEVNLGGTVSLHLPTVAPLPIAVTVPTKTTTQNLAPGESVSFPLINATGSVPLKLSLPLDDLSAFIGTGTIPATLDGIANYSASASSGNVATSVTTKAGGTVTLTYIYTPNKGPNQIPEPSANLGLFFLGGLALRRFLKSKQN